MGVPVASATIPPIEAAPCARAAPAAGPNKSRNARAHNPRLATTNETRPLEKLIPTPLKVQFFAAHRMARVAGLLIRILVFGQKRILPVVRRTTQTGSTTTGRS